MYTHVCMCNTLKQTSFHLHLYYLTPEQTQHYAGNYDLIIHGVIHPRIIWRWCVYI
jgi:hypothetical protein